MSIRDNYNHTLAACYVGYVTQAIINNFLPLLFLRFQKEFSLSLGQITALITANFGIQLLVDYIAAHSVDRIGYRTAMRIAHFSAASGLSGLAFFPQLFGGTPYAGLLACVALCSIGGGLTEVLVSPIVEAVPTTSRKAAAMSLLHSFYCWGQMAVVALSTLFFCTAGLAHWRWLACLWALIPLLNGFYFGVVPIRMPVETGDGLSMAQLARNRFFWILVVMMLCAGASELGMSQWASSFAEAGLGVSKTLGDLAGPCLFAAFMGSARVLYAAFSTRMNLRKYIAGSCVLCVASYLLASLAPWPLLGLAGCCICGFSVGIFWPGVFSIAAAGMPRGGTAMFALLALAGDLGCGTGPTLIGVMAGRFGDNLKAGLGFGAIFPAILLAMMAVSRRVKTGEPDAADARITEALATRRSSLQPAGDGGPQGFQVPPLKMEVAQASRFVVNYRSLLPLSPEEVIQR
ncbi:MAG: MFS transporter [Kiritimatiellia bacterium]|jgi:fucose permease